MTGKRKVVRKKRAMKPKRRPKRKVRRKAKRKNQIPTTKAWRRKWESATGKKIRKAKKPSQSLRSYKAGMEKAFSTSRMPSFRASVLRGVGKVSTRPKKRRKARRKTRAVAKRRPARRKKAAMNPMRRYRRKSRRRGTARLGVRRNPQTITRAVKAMIGKPAVSGYAYGIGGFIAGAVLPRVISNALAKAGIALPGGVIGEALLGVGASVGAGALTAVVTKDTNAGIKVTAGGLAGVVGAMIVRKLDTVLPAGISGLGQNAETAIRGAVDEELRRAGLKGLGQFITTQEVEASPEVSGAIGQFLTPTEVEYAPEVSGLDQDITEGAAAFDGFEGDNF